MDDRAPDAARHAPVHVRADIPGFIGNRLQHALKREAIAIVAAGVCDAETLDEVVSHGFGARLGAIGPLEQADLGGLELTLPIHEMVMPALDRTPSPTRSWWRRWSAANSGCRSVAASATGARARPRRCVSGSPGAARRCPAATRWSGGRRPGPTVAVADGGEASSGASAGLVDHAG